MTTMTVVEHGAGGPPDCMRLIQVPIPVPKNDEVLIKVAYAGVNRPDVLQRLGRYPPPADASPYMGLEASGVIAALGDQVAQWKVGDQVCALLNGGAYAQFVTAPAGQVMSIPAGVSLQDAAAIPETYITVFSNVFQRGRLQAGESVLIHGGSSGIGVTAIQLAKQIGCTVYCTVGSSDKAAACESLGASCAMNYRTEDFEARIKELTAGKGVNLVLDMVGVEYTNKNLRCLAVEGRLVQIGLLRGGNGPIDIAPLMVNRLTFTGSTLRPRSKEQKAQICRDLQQQFWPVMAQGKALPVIDKVFDLSEVVAAHTFMESSTHIGKIVLKVAG
jgi:NADPH:quinone reductase